MTYRHTKRMGAVVLALAFVLAPTASFAADRGAEHGRAHKSPFAAAWFGFNNRTAVAATASDTPAKNLAPVISGVSAPTVLTVGETGTWSIDASDPENGTLKYSIDWGESKTLSLARAFGLTFTQTATFTHSYDTEGVYTVKVTVKDDKDRTSTSSATVRVVADTSPVLTISDVGAAALNSSHVLIRWNSNLRSDSTVYYSESTPVDTATALSVSHRGKVLKHRVPLTNLKAGTTYYFIVESKGINGGVATSAEASFTTPGAQNGAPTIAHISGPETIEADTEGTWTVEASDPENGTLKYSVDWGDTSLMGKMMAFMAPQQEFTQTSTFTHTYASAGTYTITVTVQDEAGLKDTETTKVTVTEEGATGPAISNVAISAVSSTEATVTWNTDEESNSNVWFGTTSPDTSVPPAVADGALSTTHSAKLIALNADTQYYVIVGSRDAEGNLSLSQAVTFTTADNDAPLISKLAALVGSDHITFTWNTNEATDATLYYSKTSPVVVGGADTKVATDATLGTSHTLDIVDLMAGITYYFFIESKDAGGASVTTPQFSLTTMSM